VAGVGIITLGDESFNAQAGNYFFIPKKTPHRAENTGGDTFKIIEVQIGDYLEEDDIVRLQDEYGRT
jgi:mannose-6-phosphate isomerase-like protein (cupin superfamily)